MSLFKFKKLITLIYLNAANLMLVPAYAQFAETQNDIELEQKKIDISELSTNSTSSQDEVFSLSFEQLANIKVITSSKREQSVDDSYANVTVISKEMIEQRGYRNIIEVLEDLPGFDFATYEDGGGEYPVHNLNRGIGGDNGNTRMMVMVDGIVQNHISFNWAQGLTDEQMLIDVERIEIVQGPGSALYGAQAVSGIIHIITQNNFQGRHFKLLGGDNSTNGFEMLLGGSRYDVNYQLAYKNYQSAGDGGKGRPDPGGYFSGNVYPDYLTANYDEQGNYQTNESNFLAGQSIPDGFNNSKKDHSFRLRISTDSFQTGINYWNKKHGLGSYVVAYEYDATADDFITHHRAISVYVKNKKMIIEKQLKWNSDLWYRVDQQMPDTGFRYTYRFNTLKKSYHSSSNQLGFENQLDWRLDDDLALILGLRLLNNRQSDQVVSLGQIQSGDSSATNSAWDLAIDGTGLGQEKINKIYQSTEQAIYFLLEGNINSEFSYSLGSRYSNASDYGNTNTPRAGIIYRSPNRWVYKLLYGSAFRQPSLFELNDEFRGNPGLKPENIDTLELEISNRIGSIGYLKFNLFFSDLQDSINLVSDPTRAGGERYANESSSQVRGLSMAVDYKLGNNLTVFTNYLFQQGNDSESGWGKLAHTAQHKLNFGLNWQAKGEPFYFDIRGNFVGSRKVPESNQYFEENAPGYQKLNLVAGWKELFGISKLSSQLIVKNLFDEQYFGVGRQAGSSVKSDYSPSSNPNPAGFIPAYHPQPGRHFYLSLSYQL